MDPEVLSCEWCHESFLRYKLGRRPRFCSASHRQAAFQQRRIDRAVVEERRRSSTHFVGDDCPGGHRDDPHVGDPT